MLEMDEAFIGHVERRPPPPSERHYMTTQIQQVVKQRRFHFTAYLITTPIGVMLGVPRP